MISSTSTKNMTTGESPNIEYVEGESLELNRIFWELEEESFAKGGEFTGK